MKDENPFGRRYAIEIIATMTVSIGVLLSLPPPGRAMVNGKEVVLVTLFGWVVPDWFLKVAIGVFMLTVYGVVAYLGYRWWPEKESVEEPNIHPIVPTPRSEDPWALPPDTTAAEYLNTTYGVIPVFMTEEEEDAEVTAYLDGLDKWLAIAPESTLRELIPECERLIEEKSRGVSANEYVVKVLSAHHERGIPAREDIEAMVTRIRDRGVSLRDIGDWFDGEGPD